MLIAQIAMRELLLENKRLLQRFSIALQNGYALLFEGGDRCGQSGFAKFQRVKVAKVVPNDDATSA